MDCIRFYKPPNAPKSPKLPNPHPPHSKATLPSNQEINTTEKPDPEPILTLLPEIQPLNHPLPKKPLVSFPGESLASSLEEASISGIKEIAYNPVSENRERSPSRTRFLDNSLYGEKSESQQCSGLQGSTRHQLFSLPSAAGHLSVNQVSRIQGSNLEKDVEEGDSPCNMRSRSCRLGDSENILGIHSQRTLSHAEQDRSPSRENLINRYQDDQARYHQSFMEAASTPTESTALRCTPNCQYLPTGKQPGSDYDNFSRYIPLNKKNQTQPYKGTSGLKAPRVEVIVPQRYISPTLEAEAISSSEDNDDPGDVDFQSEPSASDEEPVLRSRLQRKRQISAGSDSQPKRPRTRTRPSVPSKPAVRQSPPKIGSVRPVPLVHQPLCQEHYQQFGPSSAEDSDSIWSEETLNLTGKHYPERITISGFLELSPGRLGNSIIIRGFLPHPAKRNKRSDISRSPELDKVLAEVEPVLTDGEEFDHCKMGRRFSKAEDELILILRENGYDWKYMERFFTHRKHTALRSRWTRQLQHGQRK